MKWKKALIVSGLILILMFISIGLLVTLFNSGQTDNITENDEPEIEMLNEPQPRPPRPEIIPGVGGAW